MSGHSKWASIKRQKGVADAKKGVLFGKISREITVSAREGGGDPDMNFRLRLAIERAKGANLPKDNIERAIKKGTGDLQGEQIEELMYEAYGPGGIPFIIETMTDNKNRTVAEVRHIFTKHDGAFGASVQWMFDRFGVIRTKQTDAESLVGKNKDELELELIDLGVADIKEDEDGLILYCAVDDLHELRKKLQDRGYDIEYAALEYVAKEDVTVTDPAVEEKLKKIMELLDDHQDVLNFYTNVSL